MTSMYSSSDTLSPMLSRLQAVVSRLEKDDLGRIEGHEKWAIFTSDFVRAMLKISNGKEGIQQQLVNSICSVEGGIEWIHALEQLEQDDDSRLEELVESLKKNQHIIHCFSCWSEEWIDGFFTPLVQRKEKTPPGSPLDTFTTPWFMLRIHDDFPMSEDAKIQESWRKQLWDRDGFQSVMAGTVDDHISREKFEEIRREFPLCDALSLVVTHLIPSTIADMPAVHPYIQSFMNDPDFPLSREDLSGIGNALLMEDQARYWWYKYLIAIEYLDENTLSKNFRSRYFLRILEDVGLGLQWSKLKDSQLVRLHSGTHAQDSSNLSSKFCGLHYAVAKVLYESGLSQTAWISNPGGVPLEDLESDEYY